MEQRDWNVVHDERPPCHVQSIDGQRNLSRTLLLRMCKDSKFRFYEKKLVNKIDQHGEENRFYLEREALVCGLETHFTRSSLQKQAARTVTARLGDGLLGRWLEIDPSSWNFGANVDAAARNRYIPSLFRYFNQPTRLFFRNSEPAHIAWPFVAHKNDHLS